MEALFWVLIGLPWVAVAGLVVAQGRLKPGTVERWAGSRGLLIDKPEARAMVTGQLRRATRGRAWGAAAGWLAAAVVPMVLPSPALPIAWIGSPLLLVPAGFLAGALASELTTARLAGGSGARLVARDLSLYASPSVTRVGTAVTAAAVAVSVVAVSYEPDRLAPRWALVALAALAGAWWLACVGLARLVVRRSQPHGEPAVLEIDDALRSTSVHAVLGSGMAAAFLFLAQSLFALGQAIDDPPGGLTGAIAVIALLCLPSGWAAWHRVTMRAWRVPSTSPAEMAA